MGRFGRWVERTLVTGAENGNAADAVTLAESRQARAEYEDAAQWYGRAFELGDTSAAIRAAEMFLHEAADIATAKTWYHKAVAADPTLAYELGNLHEGFYGDVDEAETWYRKAVDAGSTVGLVRLAEMYVAQLRYDEGDQVYLRAVRAGSTEAAQALALRSYAKHEKTQALRWLDKADQLASVEYAGQRAECRKVRRSIAADRQEYGGSDDHRILPPMPYQGAPDDQERDLWRRLENGESGVALELGRRLRRRRVYQGAAFVLDQAARTDDPEALFLLGDVIESGYPETGDPGRFFRKAAEAGHWESAWRLGLIYKYDREDERQAGRWFAEAERLLWADESLDEGTLQVWLESIWEARDDDMSVDTATLVRRALASADAELADVDLDDSDRDDADGAGRTRSTRGRSTNPEPPTGQLQELLTLWERLLATVPSGSDSARALAERAGVRPELVQHLRRIRNRCAHPGAQGWPSERDLAEALRTARMLCDRVGC